MKSKYIAFFAFCLSITFLSGCKTKETTIKQNEVAHKLKGETFDSFYSKFTTDSKFQISRVTFPLECQIAEPEREMQVMQKSDWVLMKVPIDKVDRKIYKINKSVNPTEVTHRIYIPNSDVDILIRYRQIKGKWYLVYYKSIML